MRVLELGENAAVADREEKFINCAQPPSACVKTHRHHATQRSQMARAAERPKTRKTLTKREVSQIYTVQSHSGLGTARILLTGPEGVTHSVGSISTMQLVHPADAQKQSAPKGQRAEGKSMIGRNTL
jgi:hypothetical protein